MLAAGIIFTWLDATALTFYRDPGYVFVAKTYPLTKNVDSLITVLAQTPALGGGDDPESVREGLFDCYKNAGWDLSHHGSDPDSSTDAGATQPATRAIPTPDNSLDRKIMILMGDAPPHPGTEKDCVALAKKAAENGFKVYTVKLTTPLGEDKGVLPSFDDIAKAGGGASFSVDFAGTSAFEFRGTLPEKQANYRYIWLAKITDKVAPSKELLTRILLDAVNPKYRERIEMVVPILLEVCERPVPEIREPFKPAETPAPKPPPGPGPGPQAPAPPAPKHKQH